MKHEMKIIELLWQSFCLFKQLDVSMMFEEDETKIDEKNLKRYCTWSIFGHKKVDEYGTKSAKRLQKQVSVIYVYNTPHVQAYELLHECVNKPRGCIVYIYQRWIMHKRNTLF